MSWLSAAFGLSKLTQPSTAIKAANVAVEKFVAYAKTDSYTAIYELIQSLKARTDLSGNEKRALVLKSAASDVKVFGEYFIKAVIEIVLSGA
jgi:hypothetical protein